MRSPSTYPCKITRVQSFEEDNYDCTQSGCSRQLNLNFLLHCGEESAGIANHAYDEQQAIEIQSF